MCNNKYIIIIIVIISVWLLHVSAQHLHFILVFVLRT
jgi:hypothetical protein